MPSGTAEPGTEVTRTTAPASGDTCVYVVGMHRSGTSATAGVLGHLGLGAPPADDLVPATARNMRGHWESKGLTSFNEQLLVHVGGTWSAPPALGAGWLSDATLEGFRDEAAQLFRATFGARPLAWKDPRTCIVLPFWQRVVDPPTAAVFVYREPLEVAGSLRSRNAFEITHGLALWERYVRAAAANLEGIPTLAIDYAALLEDPGAFCGALVSFLESVGVTVGDDARADAVASLDADLRHERAGPTSQTPPSSDATDVFATLRASQGVHHPWRAPDLGSEPAWVGDVLAMRLAYETTRRELMMFRRSRAYKFARTVATMRHRVTRR